MIIVSNSRFVLQKDDEAEHTMNSPRMFLTYDSKCMWISAHHEVVYVQFQNSTWMRFIFPEPHMYQLRAYIYQARDLIPSDQGGYSGAYGDIVKDVLLHGIECSVQSPWS